MPFSLLNGTLAIEPAQQGNIRSLTFFSSAGLESLAGSSDPQVLLLRSKVAGTDRYRDVFLFLDGYDHQVTAIDNQADADAAGTVVPVNVNECIAPSSVDVQPAIIPGDENPHQQICQKPDSLTSGSAKPSGKKEFRYFRRTSEPWEQMPLPPIHG